MRLDGNSTRSPARLLGVALLLMAAVAALVCLSGRPGEGPTAKPAGREPTVRAASLHFTDVTQGAGLRFVHENGAYGAKLLPETMGSGCAFFDFDNDGDQDLLLVNGCAWPWQPEAAGSRATSALYRNDGSGRFVDVTAGSGLDVVLYGMGIAIGDYDNDGWSDVFLSALGSNRLFRNMRGQFVEVTREAGVAGATDAWSTSCGWCDYDRDGRLDLLVCNYVEWSREIDEKQDFRLAGAGRAYGPPTAFNGTFPYLYHNEGGGRFREVAARAGMHVTDPVTKKPLAKALGLALIDLDDDGWMDVVLANDTVPNLVFHNQRDGTFVEIGAAAGIAFDSAGNARGAMGIDAAYFRNDDALGLAIGNFADEMTALYVSHRHELLFSDEAVATGLGLPTRLELKFGLFFCDLDLDGWLDLLSANGHLENDIAQVQAGRQHAQPPHFFWNRGLDRGLEYQPVTPAEAGAEFFRPMVGRGAAFADMDGDGDLDVLLTANRGAPRLLRNDQPPGHHWLRLKLVGTQSPREAIGAWIAVEWPTSPGPLVLRRQVMPTRSYLSQVELPVTIGLGTHAGPCTVHIRWPNGTIQAETVMPDQLVTIRERAIAP